MFSNGDSVRGDISMNTEVLIHQSLSVQSSDKPVEKIFLHDVSAIKIGSNTYELRHIAKGWPGHNLYFMRRLTTPDSKIHLYEHRERTLNHRSDSRDGYNLKYYAQFDNEPRYSVWPLSGHRFQPRFDRKVSQLLKKCPALAAKIMNKEEGYFYSAVNATEAERLKILLQIIKYYNQCLN